MRKRRNALQATDSQRCTFSSSLIYIKYRPICIVIFYKPIGPAALPHMESLFIATPRKSVHVENKYILLHEEVGFDGYIKSSASRSTLHTYERVY